MQAAAGGEGVFAAASREADDDGGEFAAPDGLFRTPEKIVFALCTDDDEPRWIDAKPEQAWRVKQAVIESEAFGLPD